jgi:hypothetical protein
MRPRSSISLILALLLLSSGCFSFPFGHVLRDAQKISDLTVQGDSLCFGAGYHLYRLNLNNQKIETIFTTDRILVEQPLVADDVVYAGGRQYANDKGVYGKSSRFFAVALKDQQLQWAFPLGADGYGTYGASRLMSRLEESCGESEYVIANTTIWQRTEIA